MPIPRTSEEWRAITPNETDIELVSQFDDACLLAPDPPSCIDLAAAARLHEQERCVEMLARARHADWDYLVTRESWESTDDQTRAHHIAEARRILGCEPESPDAYFRADYASNRREARRGLVGEPESGEKGGSNG